MKQAGIRFQAPLDKIKIHWSDGVKTYDDAKEAAQDLRERGFPVETPGEERDKLTARGGDRTPALEQEMVWRRGKEGTVEWQQVGGERERRGQQATRRAKEKLQGFKRT